MEPQQQPVPAPDTSDSVIPVPGGLLLNGEFIEFDIDEIIEVTDKEEEAGLVYTHEEVMAYAEELVRSLESRRSA